MSDLPLNGRTFAQLATLVPGVAPQGSKNIATDRKRGSIGTAFAITANGFSDVQNSFIYDGVAAMDLDSYNFAFSPSIDAISEFRVQTNSYSAACGGAPGAQVDVITKSGTNVIRGDVHDKLLRIRDKVYRIASESLRKAVTHAQARHITVTIQVRCQRGAGTEIGLRVPAAIAYSTRARASSWARWLSRWSGRPDV